MGKTDKHCCKCGKQYIEGMKGHGIIEHPLVKVEHGKAEIDIYKTGDHYWCCIDIFVGIC